MVLVKLMQQSKSRRPVGLLVALSMVLGGCFVNSGKDEAESWGQDQVDEILSDQLPAFTSFPPVAVRDCILEAAIITDEISHYDELDRDFLVSYASQLSFEAFLGKTKGKRSYSDDLDVDAAERLLKEAKTNRTCREKQ